MVSGAMKTVFVILGIILILGGVGALIFFNQDSGLQETGAIACSGGQVLSVQDINVRFSNELQKEVIRVVFSTVPTSECLDIFVSESQIEDSIDGFNANEPIRGDIFLTKKDIEFDIIENQNNKFLKYDLNTIAGGIACTNSDCRNAGLSSVISSIATGFFGNDCTCVSENLKGVGGRFSDGSNLKWETEIEIGSDSLTLNNNDLSGEVGNIAVAKWAGNLAGNIGFSSPNREVYKPFSDNQFRMINLGTYDLLINDFNELNEPLVFAGTPGTTGFKESIDDARAYNALFDSRTTNGLNSWVNQEQTVKSASIQSNKLIVNLNSPIVYPQFTLDIVAEEVGIFISVGKPRVNCPNNFDIISGESRDVKVNLANIGADSGSFSYGLSCTKGSSILSPTPPESISSGQSRSINARIGLTVEEGTETSSCTFTATELNTFEKDTCSFSFTSTKQTQCLEGTSSCERGNKELWTCLSDGSFDKVECDFGCEAFEDTFRCRLQQNEICDDGIDNDGDDLIDFDDPECSGKECGAWISVAGTTIIPDLFCVINQFMLKFRIIFSVILGVLGGLLGISYLLKFLPKSSETKTKVIWSIVTFLILGIALFLLALIYFWFILLFILIIGIIRIFVPGV